MASRCPEKEGAEDSAAMRCYGLKAGHTLTADDERDIQTVLGDANDQDDEETNAFYRIRMETIREIGGQELVEAVTAKDDALRDRLVANAMERIREAQERYKS